MNGNAQEKVEMATEKQKFEIAAALVKSAPGICEGMSKKIAQIWVGDQRLLTETVTEAVRNALMPAQAKEEKNFFTILINYDRSVEDGIKAGNYDWKNDDISSKNFPSQEAGTREVTVDLFHFGKDMSTDEVLADLDKQGYRPATLKELLALGEKHPDLQREFPIIGLGSVWQDPDGFRYCPFLRRVGSGRGLRLRWLGNGWGDDCRFAAVRK